MSLVLDLTHPVACSIAPQWHALPPRMRALCIAESQATIDWLEQALAADSATQVALTSAVGLAAGATALRDELFEAIIVAHCPGQLDALELVSGLRTGGSEEPILIVGGEPEEALVALAYESGADAYHCLHTTSIRALLWSLARGRQRFQLVRENRRLAQFERSRTEQDERETQHLLLQQRAIVHDLESLRSPPKPNPGAANLQTRCPGDEPAGVPAELVAGYRELLRAYVIMGAGNLSGEMDRFANLLAASGFTAHQALELHLRAVEELVQGLRSRGTRHVMNRADLLVLEVMLHLAEAYRRRYDGAHE